MAASSPKPKRSRALKVLLILLGLLLLSVTVLPMAAWFVYWFVIPWRWHGFGALRVRLPDGGRLVYDGNDVFRYGWRMYLVWTPRNGKKRILDSTCQHLCGPGAAADYELRLSDDKRLVFEVTYTPPEGYWQAGYLDLTWTDDQGPAEGEKLPPTPPGWPVQNKGKPLGRRAELGDESHGYDYVIWRAPQPAETPGARIAVQWGRFVIEATGPAFYDGEWRGDDKGRFWMVDWRTPGHPKVRAALDRAHGMFWDEKRILWRWNPQDEGKPKVTRSSSSPQPYPNWATVDGGELLTPWRRPPGPCEPEFAVNLPVAALSLRCHEVGEDKEEVLTVTPPGGESDDLTLVVPVAADYDDLEVQYKNATPAVQLFDYSDPEIPQDYVTRALPFHQRSEEQVPAWTDGKPMGRRSRLRVGTSVVYVDWLAQQATRDRRTSIVRAGPLVGRFREQLVLKSTYVGYQRGEWRVREDGLGVWMVEHPREGEAGVRAAIDLSQWLFYDERGGVWKVGTKPGEPMTKVSRGPAPYPSWATVTGGKSETPWRVREHAGVGEK
jgi:hypothetical protein